MVNLYVLNDRFERIGIIDTYASIIWTNRYFECGDFELYMQCTSEMIDLLQIGRYLIREGKEDNAMIIETVNVSTDHEQGNYLTVSGRCLKSIVYRRIIWNQTTLNGQVEICIARLLNDNIINPTDTVRKIINFQLGSMVETGIAMNVQYTGDNVGEVISAICTNYGIGWDIKLDIEHGTLTFILYKGTDRSCSQEIVPWIVFSNEFENLLTTNYSFDKSKFANVAKVAGEGEGSARKTTTIGSAKGFERYESFVDAKDLSSNDGEITLSEYYKQLAERGTEKLAETTNIENFDGEVVSHTYKYGTDYFLGDIVEVINEYGMEAVTRVIEVIESEDETGAYTIPTFSSYS